jgi:hypothetical protein
MTIKKFISIIKSISVSGDGWNPQGKFFQNKKIIDPLKIFLKKLSVLPALNSRARLINKG